jgi:hypothetical protein
MQKHSQGVLQGKITKHANNPAKLKALMDGRSDEVKRLARIHLKMVHWRGRKK